MMSSMRSCSKEDLMVKFWERIFQLANMKDNSTDKGVTWSLDALWSRLKAMAYSKKFLGFPRGLDLAAKVSTDSDKGKDEYVG